MISLLNLLGGYIFIGIRIYLCGHDLAKSSIPMTRNYKLILRVVNNIDRSAVTPLCIYIMLWRCLCIVNSTHWMCLDISIFVSHQWIWIDSSFHLQNKLIWRQEFIREVKSSFVPKYALPIIASLLNDIG